MYDLRTRVVARRRIGRELVVLGFEAASIAEVVRAGQFVNLGLPAGPLLRRPFSVHTAADGVIEVLLKAVGYGTRLLTELREGDLVACLGPLGRGFELDPDGGPVYLVSGGLGAAPMPLAARQAARLGLDVTWVHGARSAADLNPEWYGDRVLWATDDGSQGRPGPVLEAIPNSPGQILACGPNPMLRALAGRFPQAQVALETHMGCGTGVCLGCVVPKRGGGYDRACSEGPVYRAGEVDWDRLPAHLHYARVPA